jgi:hypothetical protein
LCILFKAVEGDLDTFPSNTPQMRPHCTPQTGLKDLSNPFEAFGGRIACFFKGLAMEELLSNQDGK